MAKVTEDMRALGVRVPKRLIKRLKQIALNNDSSLSEILIPALERFVTENEAQK